MRLRHPNQGYRRPPPTMGLHHLVLGPKLCIYAPAWSKNLIIQALRAREMRHLREQNPIIRSLSWVYLHQPALAMGSMDPGRPWDTALSMCKVFLEVYLVVKGSCHICMTIGLVNERVYCSTVQGGRRNESRSRYFFLATNQDISPPKNAIQCLPAVWSYERIMMVREIDG